MELTLEKVRALAKSGFNLIPIVSERLADLETPLSAYLKLRSLGANMLLESVEGGEKWGRFSIIGIGNLITVKSKGRFAEIVNCGEVKVKEFEKDPLEVLEGVCRHIKPWRDMELPRMWGGFFGYLSYEAVNFFEPKVSVNPHKEDSHLYDMLFSLPSALLIFDNVNHKITTISYIPAFGEDVEGEYVRAKALLEKIEKALSGAAPPFPPALPSTT